eukprot:10959811-Alexandrium_andersonii.AAC.1
MDARGKGRHELGSPRDRGEAPSGPRRGSEVRGPPATACTRPAQRWWRATVRRGGGGPVAEE